MMKLPNYLRRAALTLLAVFAITDALNAAEEKPRPNVLFLIADDLNCDLHCYGHPQVQTPNIDKLAARGVMFRHAYCQYPLCSPSRSSFLTGRRPDVTKVLDNPNKLKDSSMVHPHFRDAIPDTVTMPELFRKNGYTVQRVGKLYHYGVPGDIGTDGLDDAQSWEQRFNPKGRDKTDEDKVAWLVPGRSGGVLAWLAADGTDEEQTDGMIATKAVEMLKAQPKGKPFFFGIGFFRPHIPFVAPKKYFDLYPPDKIPLPALSADDKSRTPPPAYMGARKDQDTMTDEKRREAIQAYHASISFMDAQVGRVVDALDRLGLGDNTIIVFTSDHGFHMAEHGLWQKMTMFENSAHIPFMIYDPRAKGNGRTTESLAELLDLYPTLAEACGLKAPGYLDGVSQVPVLNDPAKSVRAAAYTQIHRAKFEGYGVRTERFRYTLWDGGKLGEQLFDLVADPGETKNLAADPAHAKDVAELRELLAKHYKL